MDDERGETHRPYLAIGLILSLLVTEGKADVGFSKPCFYEPESDICFRLVNTSARLDDAQAACNAIGTNGNLASILTAEQQSAMAGALRQAGISRAWTAGHIHDQSWNWYTSHRFIAYQGCFTDVPGNRDLPRSLTDPTVNKPSLCMDRCRQAGFMYAGVQLTEDRRTMLCHCGNTFSDHGRSYEETCNSACPEQATTSSGNPIDSYCGGFNQQLVFNVEGTKFHAWVAENKRGDHHCVAFHHPENHMWVDTPCTRKLGRICERNPPNSRACLRELNHKWVGVCVTIDDDPTTWFEAVTDCHKDGSGRFLMVDTAEIYTRLLPYLRSDTSYWFDLTYNMWLWLDQWKRITFYTAWDDGYPVEGTGLNCISLVTPDFKWQNTDCNTRLPFVCVLGENATPKPTIISVDTDTPRPTVSSPDSPNPGPSGPSTTSPPPQSLGLSTATIIGIGVGAGLMFVAGVGSCIGVCVWVRNSPKRKLSSSPATSSGGNRNRPPAPLPPDSTLRSYASVTDPRRQYIVPRGRDQPASSVESYLNPTFIKRSDPRQNIVPRDNDKPPSSVGSNSYISITPAPQRVRRGNMTPTT